METWTIGEVLYVINHYPNSRTTDIARDLGRSVRDIHRQAKLRGVQKSQKLKEQIELDWILRKIEQKKTGSTNLLNPYYYETRNTLTPMSDIDRAIEAYKAKKRTLLKTIIELENAGIESLTIKKIQEALNTIHRIDKFIKDLQAIKSNYKLK